MKIRCISFLAVALLMAASANLANRLGAASGKDQNSESRPVELATIAARCRPVVVKQQRTGAAAT